MPNFDQFGKYIHLKCKVFQISKYASVFDAARRSVMCCSAASVWWQCLAVRRSQN